MAGPGEGLAALAEDVEELEEEGVNHDDVMYDLDGDAVKIDEFDLDGWVWANSDSDNEEAAPAAGEVSATAKSREEFEDLAQRGLTFKPQGGTIGVHLGNSVWRAGTASGPVYGRTWGGASGRTPMQALIRVLMLMWTDHVAQTADDKLATKILGRLSKLWEGNPGKP